MILNLLQHISYLDGSTVLIGGQSSDNVGGATCNLQLEGTSTDRFILSLKCNSNDSGSIPTINFGKSRGTSVGSDTIIQDGDNLGVINLLRYMMALIQ